MDTVSAWRRFGRWRRRRPFWGGLLLLLAGLALFFSANLTLADMKVHFGQEGYLSYLLPLILVLCGALIWATPAQRLFYAVIGLVTALYSLIGLNLGGFGVGMLLGIVGGALALAWTPGHPAAPPPPAQDGPEASAPAGPEAPPFASPGDDGPPTVVLPGTENHGTHRKLFVVTLVPLVAAAGWLIAGSPAPARADDCPEGLPSRSAAASPQRSRPAAASPQRSRPASSPTPAREPTRTAKPAPSPSATDDGTGNPFVDGWNDVVEGIGDLFGGGPAGTPPSSSSSVSPSPSSLPSGSARPAPAAPSGSRAPSRSASASPSPSLPDVPCLGPRVVKSAAAGAVPPVSRQGGILEGDSLTMYNSTYDGVVDLPTATGTIKVLKFSMRKSVTKPFSLTIPERDGRTTVIRSKALTTEGNVRFYTPRFSGKLFGLFRVTFTPDQPPPLTLPVLWFTDVKINLAFVRCDRLTADPLDLREQG